MATRPLICSFRTVKVVAIIPVLLVGVVGVLVRSHVLELVTPCGASSTPWLHWYRVTVPFGGKPFPVTCSVWPFLTPVAGFTEMLGQYWLAAADGVTGANAATIPSDSSTAAVTLLTFLGR